MFPTMLSALLALAGAATIFHAIGMWAALRARARKSRATEEAFDLPPITLLKPIKGEEEELEANLRSFLAQDYPAPLQAVFASAEPGDPGIAIARRVAAEYPHVPCDFVLARDAFGLNPKVSTMHAGLQRAHHDLVLQSDANVRLRPGHLARMVSEMQIEAASLLGSLVIGDHERSIGATLENLQLTTFTAPGICTAKELGGVNCVLGKAMLFRRRELEAMGGLAPVKDMLAEDFALGLLYAKHGKRVFLSMDTVVNVNRRTPIRQFLGRHSRWLKMRAVVSLPGFLADLGTNPVALTTLAWFASGLDARLLWALFGVYVYKCSADTLLLHRFRGRGLGLSQFWATPARDLSLAVVWLYASVSRSTQWRGRRLRLGRGSVLLPDSGGLPHRVLRRVGLLRTAK
jgi:ceramide glucosyltransferase